MHVYTARSVYTSCQESEEVRHPRVLKPTFLNISWSKFNSTSNKVILIATPSIPPEDSEAEMAGSTQLNFDLRNVSLKHFFDTCMSMLPMDNTLKLQLQLAVTDKLYL